MALARGLVTLLALGHVTVAGTVRERLDKRACSPEVEYSADISYLACYTDQNSPRTLGAWSTNLADNSPRRCADICGAGGYKYAGLAYSRECHCGNSIANVQADSEDACDASCPGDADESCGGTWFINVWSISNPQSRFPDCTKDPLCSNDICDTSLSPKERATALLTLWTAEEKLTNLVERAAGVPRIGISPYNWWIEGLHGLAYTGVDFNSPGAGEWDVATSFPQPISFASAFDDDLVTKIADVISTETRAFSANGRTGLNLYTPNINSFKDPRWGRGQETPGEDPFHAQSYTRALLEGLERTVDGYKKVLVTCKHYAGNDFENFGSINRHNFDAIISPQDLNEFYFAPFRTCAERDAGAFMCSYNSVNGAPACANTYLMEDILRQHWGWEKDEHWISTDCGAVQDIWEDHKYVETPGEAAAVALKSGADLNCEFGRLEAWREAWNNSLITEDDMDKALTRLWASLVSVGWFDPAGDNSLRALGWDDVNTEAAQTLAYDAAVAGSVLIKNDGSLPLSAGGSVALIGPWVNATIQMQGNYYGPAPYLISPLQAATDKGLDFTWANGSGIDFADSTFDDAIQKAREADQVIFLGGIDNTVEEEGHDRVNITWPEPQLEVLRALAALGKPVTVVQFGGGQLDGTELLEEDAINAILWSGYPGQSGGKAVLDILYGDAAPAGRLPITQYPGSYADLVPPTDMTLRPGQNGTNPGRTHMWYSGEAPVRFGHGLHYTEFEVTAEARWQGDFKCSKGNTDKVESLVDSKPWMEVLHLPVLTVSVEVENVGTVGSDYVVLLFLRSDAGPEPRPKQILAGYTRVKDIEAGESKTADITVNLDRFLRVDEGGNHVLYPGNFELFIDLDEKAVLEIEWSGDSVIVEDFPAQS